MVEGFDITKLPPSNDLSLAFETAMTTEPSTAYLSEVYRTGTMFDIDGRREVINETSMQMHEGRMLWYIGRQLKPQTIIETGFGRGGSAAFFLTSMSPWNGKLISIDPAFRHWAGDIGPTYLKALGLGQNHTLIEQPSEIFLAQRLSLANGEKLKLAYVDGSHHFDGTLIDFLYFDRMLDVGGIIGIDDAHAPAVRTVASFVANNLPYQIHYASHRLVFCQKLAETQRDWSHFRPFTSSPRYDWDVHAELPGQDIVPNATFSAELK